MIIHKKNTSLNRILYKNRAVLRNCENIVSASKHKVNLNAWIVPNQETQNVGDYVSVEVVRYLCSINGCDMSADVKQTKHLYAVGSILLGYQDATIWGSGFGYDNSTRWYFGVLSFIHKHYHKTDIRAVRGPETRRILMKMGYDCPEIYGDPAVLLPLIYSPKQEKTEPYVVIPHYSKLEKYIGGGERHILGSFRRNYKEFVDRICRISHQ